MALELEILLNLHSNLFQFIVLKYVYKYLCPICICIL